MTTKQNYILNFKGIMPNGYFAQYESPNIVIVPTVTTKKHSLDTTAVTVSTEPSTIRQDDIKYPKVLSETFENSFVNNERNMSTNVGDIDSVEEALRQLHNVQTIPALLSTQHLSSQHQVTFIPISKYSFQKNLIDLTNTNTIKTDKVTLKSVDSLNKQEKHKKVSKCINIGANEEHVPDFVNSDMTEQEQISRNRIQNINRSTYSNNVTINNMNSTTKSYRIENKLNHITHDQKKDSRSIINQTETNDSHYKSSRKRNREQEDCNDKDKNKICLEQRKVLKVKSSSNNNKHDKKYLESSSKHNNLKFTSKEQKHEYENIKPNNDVLKSTTLSREQKDDITSGALKRYLDYQRFIGKYYNNISEYDEKTIKTSCLRDPKLIEERSSKYLKRTKDIEASINVKPIMEQKEKLKLKSTIERAKKKLDPKKKLNSYIDKKISHKQSTNNERQKNKEDSHEKASTERMKKKEEIQIKLTSYIANKKKKEKSNERYAKYLEKDETNNKLTSCSDKREQSKDRKSESSKHTLQKKEYNGKSSNNSERKKIKEETHKKANKIKDFGLKNKNIESVEEGIQKSKKSGTSTKMNSSSKQRRQKTPSPIRTVDVISKTSSRNFSTSSISNIDLRSKLTRKRTINQCNTDFARVKSPPVRENLLVTLKQKVQAKPPASSQAASKPKVQKSKKIKLVINIKCPNSNDDSDEATNESEHEITNENTSPHQDLSFLDDIDIDGIVDSLNASQRIKSPIRESSIIAEENCDDAHSCENKYNSNKDSHFNAIHRSDLLLLKNEESNVRSINKIINPQVTATKIDINLLKEYNDDVYEVIDISDDIENNIILVDDDNSLVSTDQKENIKQSMVSHTKVVSKLNNKSDILLTQSKKVIQKVPIIHINDDSRDGTDVIYIEDTEITQRELPDTKYSIAQFEPKYAIQETPNIEFSNVPITPKKENEINIKSEYKGESDIVLTSDSISKDTDNPHIKNESHSASICLSTNIKKEVGDASIHSSLNIKNEDCGASIVSLPNIKNEDCDATIVSLTNIKKEARNDVISTSTSVKKEPRDETIHIAQSENVPVQSNTPLKNNGISPANEISVQNATIIKSENENCASSECGSNSKKDVNLSKHTPVIKKLKTKITKNETKQTITSKTKNQRANPVTSTAPSTKIQSIPKVTALKTDDKVKKPVLKFVKKKCATNPDETAMAKNIGGNLSKAYINTMEKQMLEYLHKNYTVLDFIHGGYFSNIYKCKDPNGGLYAVKVLKTRFFSMGIYKERIFKGLQKIRNKEGYFNLEIISHFNLGDELCLLTEYYPKTLAQALANKKLHIDVVQTLSRQLVFAVRMLTCNYIVHSDIKPDHILLNSTDERLKLCGFERADYNYNINIIPSTGTPSYRAPEIILGYNADYKIDVWATALVMYEMASGVKLFPGRYNNQILYHQICTLGPIDIDMLKNGTQVHRHFAEANFMHQVGPKEYVCISEFPVESFKLRNFNNNARKPIRTLRQITEGPDKIVILHKLLKRMLVIHPKHRIPITDVASSEFLY